MICLTSKHNQILTIFDEFGQHYILGRVIILDLVRVVPIKRCSTLYALLTRMTCKQVVVEKERKGESLNVEIPKYLSNLQEMWMSNSQGHQCWIACRYMCQIFKYSVHGSDHYVAGSWLRCAGEVGRTNSMT